MENCSTKRHYVKELAKKKVLVMVKQIMTITMLARAKIGATANHVVRSVTLSFLYAIQGPSYSRVCDVKCVKFVLHNDDVNEEWRRGFSLACLDTS